MEMTSIIYAVIFLHLLSMRLGVQATLPSEITTGLNKIESTASRYGNDETTAIQEFKDFLDSPDGESAVASVSGPISNIGNSMNGLTSGDIIGPTVAVFDIVTSISAIIPVVGPIVGVISSVLATVLSLFGAAQEESMEDVVKKAVDKVMGKYQDEDIRDTAYGVAKLYGTSHSYLRDLQGLTLSAHEINTLSTHIPIYQGVTFIGYCESKITAYSDSDNKDSNSRAVYYLNLLIPLLALRSAVLTQMYMIVLSSSTHSNTAVSIKNVIDDSNEANKKFVEFLSAPQYSKYSFFTQLNPKKQPLIQGFLRAFGMQIPYFNPPSNRFYSITNVAQPRYNMWSWKNKIYKMYGVGDNNCKFKFLPVGDNGFYYIRVARSEKYVVMKNWKLWTYGAKPGLDGQWKIVQFGDGNCMMTTEWYYGYYAVMTESGWCDSSPTKGDPGPSGHWTLETA